jgi:hypothetical protein
MISNRSFHPDTARSQHRCLLNCCQTQSLILLIFSIMLSLNITGNSQTTDSIKYQVVPNLTEEEFRFYQSDFLPLSLAEKGRLSTSAFRGMPAGFYELRYRGIDFTNPVIGFWNEQWIPHWRITYRQPDKFGFAETIDSSPPNGYKPETKIVYFQTNLSYLDIDFAQYFTKKNYVRLAGNNFLRDGPYSFGYSRIEVNTYEAQVHLEFLDRWKLDLAYWQMRHRFYMIPEDILSIRADKFRQIGHIGWFRLTGKLSERDSIVFTPGYTLVNDDYWKAGPPVRDMWYEWGSGELSYYRKVSNGLIGARVNGRYIAIHGKRLFYDKKEGDGSALFLGAWHPGRLDLELQAGGYKHSELGEGGQIAMHVAVWSRPFGRLGIRLFSKPQTVPLTWRTIQNDSIPAFAGKNLMEKQGASIYAERNLGNWFSIHIEPFIYRMKNYPVLAGNVWQTQTIENYGLHFFAGLRVWRFWLQNDFTYNHNYEESFAPEVNNVSSIKSSLSLFKGALKIEGILTGHVLSYYRLLEFDRLLQNYRIKADQVGPYYLSDFKLQLRFKRFTVFMTWENLLSEDYSIVEGNLTEFRLFNFGLQWLLLN